MLGTIVNVSCILTGSVIGSFVSRGIDEKYKKALFDGLGLATVGLGANAFVSNIPKVTYPVLYIKIPGKNLMPISVIGPARPTIFSTST